MVHKPFCWWWNGKKCNVLHIKYNSLAWECLLLLVCSSKKNLDTTLLFLSFRYLYKTCDYGGPCVKVWCCFATHSSSSSETTHRLPSTSLSSGQTTFFLTTAGSFVSSKAKVTPLFAVHFLFFSVVQKWQRMVLSQVPLWSIRV